MKTEFKIDLSGNSKSPLEALTILSAIDPNEGFHISKDLRPPLGIYNTSISRVFDKLTKCCNKLEIYFNISTKIDVLRKNGDSQKEVVDYLELTLYAAAEHVDDIKLIVKGFFSTNKKCKSSKSASQFLKAIKKHKTLISASINAIKHNQARIRTYSVEIKHENIEHCLHGYFIEGVHDGKVGPNKIFHDNLRQVFSITSLIWEIICFVLHSSRYLNKFLETISNVVPEENVAGSDVFTKAIIAAARLPIYSFDDNHPLLETTIIIETDKDRNKLLNSNIYGSILRKWKKSNEMEIFADSSSYEGDGVTKTFHIVTPTELKLQHWN